MIKYLINAFQHIKVEFQNNEDFFDVWHDKEYYEDYLSVQEDEIGDYLTVDEVLSNVKHQVRDQVKVPKVVE